MVGLNWQIEKYTRWLQILLFEICNYCMLDQILKETWHVLTYKSCCVRLSLSTVPFWMMSSYIFCTNIQPCSIFTWSNEMLVKPCNVFMLHTHLPVLSILSKVSWRERYQFLPRRFIPCFAIQSTTKRDGGEIRRKRIKDPLIIAMLKLFIESWHQRESNPSQNRAHTRRNVQPHTLIYRNI